MWLPHLLCLAGSAAAVSFLMARPRSRAYPPCVLMGVATVPSNSDKRMEIWYVFAMGQWATSPRAARQNRQRRGVIGSSFRWHGERTFSAGQTG